MPAGVYWLANLLLFSLYLKINKQIFENNLENKI